MTTLSLTTELEAINVLLAVADEAPVQTLVTPGLLPLAKARDCLNEMSRTVQALAWHFNTERGYPLHRQEDQTITLPQNTLRCQLARTYGSTPVQRGLRLYDTTKHRYEFDEDLKADVVFLLGWDELPQAARHYIMVRAARIFQARELGSDSADRFTADQEMEALMALNDLESHNAAPNVLSDSPESFAIVQGRDLFLNF